jgi:DNA-binding beta-propeller fold protein YncE
MRKRLCNCANFGESALSFIVVVALLALPVSEALANGTLYMINGSHLYTVDTSTAATTLIGPAFDDGLAPSNVPGQFLFCADDNPDLYALPLDGSGQSFIATIGGDANRGLAFNLKTGVLYGTDNSVFGSINPVTGAFSRLADPPSEPEALAADPDNNLVYGLETGDQPNLMVYDVATDLWSIVGATTVGDAGKSGLAYDPVAQILYATDRDGSGNLYSLDPADASTTFIGSLGVAGGFTGLAFVPDPIFADGFENGDTTRWSASLP